MPAPVETSIEKGDFFFSYPPVETLLSLPSLPQGGGGIRWWNSMADFNGLWKVKIREKLLLEATSPISRKLFSPTFPLRLRLYLIFLLPFPLLISVSSLRFGFSFLLFFFFDIGASFFSLLFSSLPLFARQ